MRVALTVMAALLFLSSFSPWASAFPVTWTLIGVTFTDSGTVHGAGVRQLGAGPDQLPG
jgi:hypothetical protein